MRRFVPNWIVDTFVADPIEVNIDIQDNLIDLVADSELKVKLLDEIKSLTKIIPIFRRKYGCY